MRRFAPIALLLIAGCSGGDGTADLTPSSSQSEIATESKSIERAADKAAALIEADSNNAVLGQENSAQKTQDAEQTEVKSDK
jgi:hypothetical protein